MRGADRANVRIERRLRSRKTDAVRKLGFAVRDRRRSGFKFVRQEGDLVMRFWINDVLSDRDGVLTVILEALLQELCVWPAPHPTLSPLRFAAQGEGVRDRRKFAETREVARIVVIVILRVSSDFRARK